MSRLLQTRLLSASVLKISCGKCITNRTATQRSASIIWIILILYFCRKDHVSYEVVDAQNSSRECHKVKRFIEHNYQSMISLDSLAENCSLSKYYLSHRFAELYGKSPIAYLNEVRLASARDLLLTTNHSIEEIAGCIGFSSTSYFSQSFQKNFHESPQQFRKSHRVRT